VQQWCSDAIDTSAARDGSMLPEAAPTEHLLHVAQMPFLIVSSAHMQGDSRQKMASVDLCTVTQGHLPHLPKWQLNGQDEVFSMFIFSSKLLAQHTQTSNVHK